MTDETDISGENVENPEKGLKAHLRRHKTGYLIAGSVAATAVVTAVATTKVVQAGGASEVIAKAQNIAFFQWKPKAEVTVKLVRRGHPGYEVLVNETGERFASIRRTAEAMNLNPRDISAQLKGAVDDVKGFTFTNLGEMTS